MTTKSGTNDVHGSLFETNRDYGYGVARTRDNFTNTAAKLIRHGRRTQLKLDRDWPWAEALAAAFQRLRTIPALC